MVYCKQLLPFLYERLVPPTANAVSLATHPTFISAGDVATEDAEEFDIHFIDKNLASLMPPSGTTVAGRDVALGAVAIVLRELPSVDNAAPGVSIWEGGGGGEGWRMNHSLRRAVELHRSSGTSGETVGPYAHGNGESISFEQRLIVYVHMRCVARRKVSRRL